MSTVINTNLASLFAQNSLSNAQNNLATSVQRLSSGLRINSAKDDAAGLSISQNMQSQINGTNQSIRNLSDATNLLQVADTSLSTVQDMLLRMKQLSVQGYDGSLSSAQKMNIMQELVDLNNEINATAGRTQFNGINLLTSGSSIDSVNSDMKVGVALANTQVKVNASSGLGQYSNLGDAANTKVGGGGVNTTFNISLDSTLLKKIPGTYTFQSNGANLTMTGVFNGLAQSQTVTIQSAEGNAQGGALKTKDQTLDFSNFGIKIDLHSQIAAGITETGEQLAAALTAKSTSLVIDGKVGEITDLKLSGIAPGTFQMSYENTGHVATLGLPASLDTGIQSGVPGTQAVTFTGGSGTGATGVVAYDATGKVTGVTINAGGTGFKAGDVLSVAAAGTREVNAVTFGNLAAGDAITVAGLTFTAGSTPVTASQVADLYKGLADGATTSVTSTLLGSFSGTLSGWTTGTAAGTSVNFSSSSAVGNQTGVTVTGGTLANVSTATAFTAGNTGVTASYTNAGLASSLAAGNQLTVDGLTLTATGAMTDAEVATAFAAASSAGTSTLTNFTTSVVNGHIDGTRGNWTITTGTGTGGAGTGLVFTSTVAGAVAGPTITGSAAAVAKLTAAGPTTVAGGTPATYTVTFGNLATGDSFTLGGRTFTANTYTTGTQLADAFVNGTTTNGAFTGSGSAGHVTDWDLSNLSTNTARVTSTVPGPQSSPSITQGTRTSASVAPSVVETTPGATTMNALTGINVNTLSNVSGSNLLKISGQVNGHDIEQSIVLTAGVANTAKTINFDAFGIQFDVTSYQNQSADDIGFALANINAGSSTGTYAATSGDMKKPGQIVVATGNNSKLSFQSGHGSDSYIDINTINIKTGSTGANAGADSEMMDVGTRLTSTSNGNLGGLTVNDDVSTWQTAFKNLVAAVDKAVDYISAKRATYGSQMNRLSFISTNLTAQSTNLQNSRSAIIDTDFASETAKLTKGQIMQQAATAMLAQANQMPNVILSLLK
jgi:flagellin